MIKLAFAIKDCTACGRLFFGCRCRQNINALHYSFLKHAHAAAIKGLVKMPTSALLVNRRNWENNKMCI